MVWAAAWLLILSSPALQSPTSAPDLAEEDGIRIVLRSGSVFRGRILSEDDKTLRLAVSFGELILKREEIEKIDRGSGLAVVVEERPEPPAAGPPKPPRALKGFPKPPPFTGDPTGEAAELQPAEKPASPASSDRRIEGILSHYLWFLPETGEMKFVLGAGFFLGFLLLFFLACKLAGIEDLSLSRALSFSAIVFTALVIQVHFDTPRLAALMGYVALDLAVWFALVKWVLREPFFRGVGVLALFVFSGLLGVLASELGYMVFSQPQA